MTKIWKGVALLCVIMLTLSLVLIGVAYISGGSIGRLVSTTDIADMTKFVSRDQLQYYVTVIFTVFGG